MFAQDCLLMGGLDEFSGKCITNRIEWHKDIVLMAHEKNKSTYHELKSQLVQKI